ncbi:hypothetical protein ACMSIO_05590 [Pseudomonas benzopyrenica]|uniref:hypothetical protein n=1 Tax=Pseudomonas benzopyrenica TaxID=2993566 RepID=UPI0039C0B11D
MSNSEFEAKFAERFAILRTIGNEIAAIDARIELQEQTIALERRKRRVLSDKLMEAKIDMMQWELEQMAEAKQRAAQQADSKG